MTNYMIEKSHDISIRRLNGVVKAYTDAKKAFAAYREKVKEEK